MEPADIFSRRELISMGMTAGIALAASPPVASAIATDSAGIVIEEAVINAKGIQMGAYLAGPKGKGPFPTILVIHEIFGLHAYIQDVCRRFAKEGYLAIAPYLYTREGDVTLLKEIEDIRAQVISKVVQKQVWKDLDATLDFVVKSKNADPNHIGITGFCWGGSVTWMYAAHHSQIKAGVAWYGKLIGEKTALHPLFPIDIAHNLKVPVLGLYGEKDSSIPLESVDKMKALLEKGKSRSQILVFQGADHGFHADYRPTYQEKAAKDAWKKTLEWFKKYL